MHFRVFRRVDLRRYLEMSRQNPTAVSDGSDGSSPERD